MWLRARIHDSSRSGPSTSELTWVQKPDRSRNSRAVSPLKCECVGGHTGLNPAAFPLCVFDGATRRLRRIQGVLGMLGAGGWRLETGSWRLEGSVLRRDHDERSLTCNRLDCRDPLQHEPDR
ncbi:unnamed protein product [Pleuronectes platessa]|uniref:Uncharacterized protein n=1 Tax=Pleuronectes platessa TaxID=8262 RepID=A0A9N7TTT1_PLEPL|nr:unnamed protein product [Pleuronectes platessa]